MIAIMSKHIIVLYTLSIIALIVSFSKIPSSQNAELNKLSKKVEKVEFYQEATRVMNNLIGFDQVNMSLSTDNDKTQHCNENQELLKEWQEDISALQNLNTDFVNSDKDAKNFLESVKNLYNEISLSCSKLVQ